MKHKLDIMLKREPDGTDTAVFSDRVIPKLSDKFELSCICGTDLEWRTRDAACSICNNNEFPYCPKCGIMYDLCDHDLGIFRQREEEKQLKGEINGGVEP